MKRLMLLAVVALGCNYYGPDNPPPDDVPPTYRYEYFVATDPNGVAFAPCPVGSLLVGGGGDCVACAPADPSAYIFGSTGFKTAAGTKGWRAACFPGCAFAQAICLTSSAPGTISQTPLMDQAEVDEITGALRAARAAHEARGR